MAAPSAGLADSASSLFTSDAVTGMSSFRKNSRMRSCSAESFFGQHAAEPEPGSTARIVEHIEKASKRKEAPSPCIPGNEVRYHVFRTRLMSPTVRPARNPDRAPRHVTVRTVSPASSGSIVGARNRAKIVTIRLKSDCCWLTAIHRLRPMMMTPRPRVMTRPIVTDARSSADGLMMRW